MPAYHRNDGNDVSKDVTVPGNVEKNRIFWLPLYVDQRLLYLYKEIVCKNAYIQTTLKDMKTSISLSGSL